ncbi:MAG: ThuA domain-containing protein [Saprospiraceae bacterium]|nr:ThuA domain-containing protein [Saprospiraceae bacterium]
MKLKYLCIGMVFLVFGLSSCMNKKQSEVSKVLIFTKTAGYHHDCISTGSEALKTLCDSNSISVDTTTNPAMFTDKVLADYAAVVFFNTTGDVLNNRQEIAFERFIQAGGGYVGVHAASDTEYGCGWYGELVGAYFVSHPKIQNANFKVEDTSFIATNFLPLEWTRKDELYNFKIVNPNVNVVLTVDENSYEGGINGDVHPMAWYHDYDGGRAFYTALGHTHESYTEELFLQHLLGGIQYAIGENVALDYSKVSSEYPPDDDRFSKDILSLGKFVEPTEMTILPNNDVVIAQRRGELLIYKSETKELKEAGFLDVYHETSIPNVNAEEGLMGLQKDPNFAINSWIYVFYSPKGEDWVNRLSRFKFLNDELQMDTEQVILDVNSQREICCHTGGSIAFGPDDLLYLSTGDNTTPFDEPNAKYVNNGYAPLNDLPGKKQYDARRSSGNTNDLRGKILRIKVNEDGSYDIPEGNLFEPGAPKTRPEIYTMGHRNPYRISVDPKNGYLYWGDVGPDANENKMDSRGPRGYDEMNQARTAGNFGWPLFIADNKAYRSYDYSNGNFGDFFDAKRPINGSKNNTGLVQLPEAQPAYVFYHYGKSSIHSELKSGGRNAMAGPTYYYDDFTAENRLPPYYDQKVIIYDWIRDWMQAVTLKTDGTFSGLEPFAPDITLNNLIDMELGPDGRLYLLEYGSKWFKGNDDSALSILDFNPGNRPPKITEFTSNVTSGRSPLEVEFTIEATDPDGDNIEYNWDFGDGNTMTSSESKIVYTYKENGSYMAKVDIIDTNSSESSSELISIVSGNTRPSLVVRIMEEDSTSFAPGVPITYEVKVMDEEDGNEGIDEDKIYVTVDYMDGFDEAILSEGHQRVSAAALGESYVKTQICKSCHKVNESSVGPSYMDVAAKYEDTEDLLSYISEKIIQGGSGVWGEESMPANEEINAQDLYKIVAFIQSLSNKNIKESMPAKGSINVDASETNKIMVITASYTDGGAENTEALTGIKKVVLRQKETGE